MKPLRIRLLPLITAAALACACGDDKEAIKRQHYDSATQLLESGKTAEAIIELRNAIQADAEFAEARVKLADAYSSSRDIVAATREYARAADLLPDDPGVQLKAATHLLLMGQFEDARSRAQRVLDRDENNVEALVIRGSALAGMRNVEGGIKELEEAIALDPTRGLTYSNLAFLQLAAGQREAARATFERAVEVSPRSVLALLALASFYLGDRNIGGVEKTLTQALSVEPNNVLANRAMAVLLMSTNRAPEAEQYFKAIVAAANDRSSRLALADYYAVVKRTDEARGILNAMLDDRAAFADAKTRLARIAYGAGQRDQAQAMLDEVLQRDAKNIDALLLQAEYQFRANQRELALMSATTAVQAEPTSVPAHFLLGTIQVAMHDTEGAAASFREVLRLNPNVGGAQIQLSRIEMARGNTAAALEMASAAAKADPSNPYTRLNLARSLIAQKDYARAGPVVAGLVKEFPQSADVHALQGSLELGRRKLDAARAAFVRAQQLNPTSFAAFSGMVSVDMLSNRIPAARAQVETRLKTAPDDVDTLLVASRVYFDANDGAAAERTLRRAIELAPRQDSAYTLLAQLYLAQGRVDAAQAEFQKIAERNPKDSGARTVVAMILHSRGKTAEARKLYEEILALDAGALIPANNLASILVEENGDLDRALTLAERVVRQRPDSPDFNATVGRVYLQKQLPMLAIEPLERAVKISPENADFSYFLGTAYAHTGNRQKARTTLMKALALDPASPRAPEARALLSTLAGS